MPGSFKRYYSSGPRTAFHSSHGVRSAELSAFTSCENGALGFLRSYLTRFEGIQFNFQKQYAEETVLQPSAEEKDQLENRLLGRFDAASQKRELSIMAECANILSQNVGLRPMFDLEVMNEDARLVLGDPGSQPSPSNVACGLSSLYKEIIDTVRKEAATITAVFPSPNDVITILVQNDSSNRVLEDRIPKLFEKLLVRPSLLNPPRMEEGRLILYLRLLAVTYEKTQDLARDLRGVGCGDLDVEGIFFNFAYSVTTVSVNQSLRRLGFKCA
ncbi:Exocyst complex component 5 [Orobanche minor]